MQKSNYTVLNGFYGSFSKQKKWTERVFAVFSGSVWNCKEIKLNGFYQSELVFFGFKPWNKSNHSVLDGFLLFYFKSKTTSQTGSCVSDGFLADCFITVKKPKLGFEVSNDFFVILFQTRKSQSEIIFPTV